MKTKFTVTLIAGLSLVVLLVFIVGA